MSCVYVCKSLMMMTRMMMMVMMIYNIYIYIYIKYIYIYINASNIVKNLRLWNCRNLSLESKILLDTERKLNAHKTFRKRPGRLLNILCPFSLHTVSIGILIFKTLAYWELFILSLLTKILNSIINEV